MFRSDRIEELRAVALKADYAPALRRDGSGWARDGARCPEWLSSGGATVATLVTRVDHARFGRTCLAAAIFVVPPAYAHPEGIWAVQAHLHAAELRWHVAWLAPASALREESAWWDLGELIAMTLAGRSRS